MVFWSSKSGINSKYTFSSSPTFTSDPWSVYTGRPKSSSALGRVSLFQFDKKQFENYLLNYGIIKSKSSSQDKMLIQEAYQILKNQVNNLTKLKHPNILTVVEPIEEHSKTFLFVTEYVTDCLESLYNNDSTNYGRFSDSGENILSSNGASLPDNILIQRGILQIVNALEFIHTRAGSVHLDLQPRSIFINENSDWKVSGLGHLVKLGDNLQGGMSTDFFLPKYDPRIPSFMHINFDYSAPELIMDNTVSFKNDFFSLGLLIYFLYSGKSLLHIENSESQYKLEYNKFERKISTMSWDNVFSKVPPQLRVLTPKLMSRDIISRYDTLGDLLDSEFFDNPLLKMLNFLDDLPTKNNSEKLVFLKGLDEYLDQFPSSLLQKKFLPILLDLLIQLCQDKELDGECISHDISLIIKIASNLSQLSFHEKLYPIIVGNKENFNILLEKSNTILIENLKILQEKFKAADYDQNFLRPLLVYVLQTMQSESAVNSQEMLLNQLDLVLKTFDFPTVKNFLLPLIAKLFVKTTSLTIKNSCVTSFQILIEKKSIDSYTVTEDLLPLFKTMKTRDPRILMKCLSLFKLVPSLVKDEVILVEQYLPLLWNYSMASTLNKSQFTEFTKVVNKISADIQSIHINKLKEGSNENYEHDNSDKNKAFTKIIEAQSQPKREDRDTTLAKSIATPAIQPRRKETPPKPSILDKRPITSSIPARRTNPSYNKSIPTASITSPLNDSQPQQSLDDEFDDFVSAATTPKPHSINNNTSPVVTPSAPGLTSLPPGFSIPLQPKKN
ncbi:Protein kinase domain profile [Nakaseomyces glabratus]|nr:Protein kinase domain profile [Nakaseomyces glabratus]KAH7600738.1 Protein kinase domain profile [Nakaseomyces glabratus]KAH7613176.1 Protein kinase domain profile [Nakaseomyces glabratus]